MDDRERERLEYVEDPLAKTNQGGIGSRNTSKRVFVYGANNSERCPVRLFKKYCRLIPPPKSCKKLYMRPKVKPTPCTWFCDQAYGSNKVTTTVKDICKEAGFQGKFTNHSLRATSASRMFQSNVPEQIIKEITGHRSECVRIYKRTSDDIRQNASNCIGGGKNETKVETVTKTECEAVENSETEQENIDEILSNDDKKRLGESLTACQIIKNVIRTRMEMRKKTKKGLGVVSKVAKKLLNQQKKLKVNKRGVCSKKAGENRIVIDLNVNVKMQK